MEAELDARWKWFLAVVGCAISFNLWAWADYPNVFETIQRQSAAWQAVGSVGAILVAVWVAKRQGEQAQKLAREAQRQAELHIAAERTRRDEDDEVSRDRAATWISLILVDVIQEADKVGKLNLMRPVPAIEEPIPDDVRAIMRHDLRPLRFAHADDAATLISHCEKLPVDAAHEVMRTMRLLGHYNAHLLMVREALEDPAIYYSTISHGKQARYAESIRIRERAKAAYDAVEQAAPAIRPRAEIFAAERLRHLAGAPEHVD